MPERIQRKRTSGWRMPENTIYVGRPSKFENPFSAREVGYSRAVELFKKWLNGELDNKQPDLISQRHDLIKNLPELKNKNLACWCKKSNACHADVLLNLANT